VVRATFPARFRCVVTDSARRPLAALGFPLQEQRDQLVWGVVFEQSLGEAA
jgi:hypothetical protein